MALLPVHTPVWQASLRVHTLPSSHAVPSAAFGVEQAPVWLLQTPTSWQTSSALHTTGLAPLQVPAWHVSVWVHLSPSSQLPVLTGFVQVPVAVSQAPRVWHWSGVGQVTTLVAVQTPVLQDSVNEHLLPSLQAVPSVALGFEQAPVFVSQVPTAWHWSLAVHVTAFEPEHLPARQPSVLVQALPSSQAVPFILGVALQAPVAESQVPVLQASSSAVQLTAVPATQLSVPKLQVSTPLQALLSLQSASLAQPHLLRSKLQPPGSTQLSTVQTILSSQATAAPPHTPPVHLSPLVQALPSPHGVLSVLLGFEQLPVATSHVPAS
jgi:hypothetical protein